VDTETGEECGRPGPQAIGLSLDPSTQLLDSNHEGATVIIEHIFLTLATFSPWNWSRAGEALTVI
jgi:hypothetical protein